MVAALILSECIFEAKNIKSTPYVTTLDVQKAFDVVDQEHLMRKLYLDGKLDDDWLILQDLCREMTTSVKWEDFLSTPFVI